MFCFHGKLDTRSAVAAKRNPNKNQVIVLFCIKYTLSGHYYKAPFGLMKCNGIERSGIEWVEWDGAEWNKYSIPLFG
jgi:hypothetical protein